MLRSYGPTGSATGWRLWIDGWALAQHEPVIAAHFRQLEAHSRSTLRALVDEGLADGSHRLRRPGRQRLAAAGPARRAVGGRRGLRVGQPGASCAAGSTARSRPSWADRWSRKARAPSEARGPLPGFVTGLRPSSTSGGPLLIGESVVVH